MALMETEDIMKILPHRFPMLLVDKIIESDFKTRIVGLKNLTINEPFFQGHFPSHPVMPGVLQLEAMAQCGGVLLNKLYARENAIAYFLSIDKARFRRPLVPGDQLRIEVVFVRNRMGMTRVHGKVFCGDELASEADLMFAYRDK